MSKGRFEDALAEDMVELFVGDNRVFELLRAMDDGLCTLPVLADMLLHEVVCDLLYRQFIVTLVLVDLEPPVVYDGHHLGEAWCLLLLLLGSNQLLLGGGP